MKTKTIKLLKKEVLVIEDSPTIDFYEITPRILAFNMKDGSIKIFKGNFTFLGKHYEITEEDVIDLVEQSLHTNLFAHYVSGINPPNIYQYKTALESFNSAIEKEIFWENPFNYEKTHEETVRDELCQCRYITNTESKFLEAQEKTFDKSRDLVFVKK